MIKCKNQQFTLIEMVAVIAIAGILFTLLVPAFSRMSRADKVEQMSSNLKLGLTQAQTKAIVSRKYVALLLPDNYLAENETNYCFGGYRLAYVKRDGENFIFTKFVPENGWKNPRDGAALLIISGSKPGKSNKTVSKSDRINCSSAPSVRTDIKASCKAIIFSPNGGIVSETPLYLKISQIIDTGDEMRVFDDNSLVIKINVLTGRAEMVEYDAAEG